LWSDPYYGNNKGYYALAGCLWATGSRFTKAFTSSDYYDLIKLAENDPWFSRKQKSQEDKTNQYDKELLAYHHEMFGDEIHRQWILFS
jgi:hypothetical protein